MDMCCDNIDHSYSQAHSGIVSWCKHLTRDNIHQLFLSQKDSASETDGYKLQVPDVSHQKV